MWKKDETPKGPPAKADFVPAKDTAESKSAPAQRAATSSGQQAIIGGSLTIEGNIKGSEDLLIEGQVNGDISLPNHLVTVGSGGKVSATIRAANIIVDGKVEGDLIGDDQIEIRRTGNVLGNIVAPRVGLEDGAQFKGNIDMSSGSKKNNVTAVKATDDKSSGKTSNAQLSG